MSGKSNLDMHQFMEHLMREKLKCEDLKAVERMTGIPYGILRRWAFDDDFKKASFEHVDALAQKTGYTHAQIRDGFAGLFTPWLEPVSA